VQNQQKAKYTNKNVLQKNGVLTIKEALKKKVSNKAKRQAIINKRNAYLVRVTRNRIKNEYKACSVAARKLERERKKRVKLLQKTKEFIPLELLEPIPDPQLSVTKADIDMQLRERLIANPAALGLDIDSLTGKPHALGSHDKGEDDFTMQSDYVSFLSISNSNIEEGDFMNWENNLDADKDAEINLF
jgi:hypothetical protein